MLTLLIHYFDKCSSKSELRRCWLSLEITISRNYRMASKFCRLPDSKIIFLCTNEINKNKK